MKSQDNSCSKVRIVVVVQPLDSMHVRTSHRLGAAIVAACVAIGIGILSTSPARIDRFDQGPSEARTLIRSSVASIGSSAEGKSDSVLISSVRNVQAAELRNAGPGPTPSSDVASGVAKWVRNPL